MGLDVFEMGLQFGRLSHFGCLSGCSVVLPASPLTCKP
jgi:hypothetical protein